MTVFLCPQKETLNALLAQGNYLLVLIAYDLLERTCRDPMLIRQVSLNSFYPSKKTFSSPDDQMGLFRAFGSWFTTFSSVLPTSQVGYHTAKPIESVVYCFYQITLSFLWGKYRHNKP